jgi:hypothetical protein
MSGTTGKVHARNSSIRPCRRRVWMKVRAAHALERR